MTLSVVVEECDNGFIIRYGGRYISGTLVVNTLEEALIRVVRVVEGRWSGRVSVTIVREEVKA
mgnify:CR=1 FL=1